MKCKYHLCKNEVSGKQICYCSVKCKNKHNVTVRRVRVKLRAVQYKGGSCKECGYKKCVEALEFHHPDESQKDFAISKVADRMSWDKIVIELDKCELLCANCHREKHYH